MARCPRGLSVKARSSNLLDSDGGVDGRPPLRLVGNPPWRGRRPCPGVLEQLASSHSDKVPTETNAANLDGARTTGESGRPRHRDSRHRPQLTTLPVIGLMRLGLLQQGVKWWVGAMPFDHPELMRQMLAMRAAQHGSGIALPHVNGSTLRWREAYSDALRWVDALERLGTRSGRPVVTIFSNSFDANRSWLGCAWLGAIEAPVNTNYKGDWLPHVVNNTEADVFADGSTPQPATVRHCPSAHPCEALHVRQLRLGTRSLPFDVLSEADCLTGATARSGLNRHTSLRDRGLASQSGCILLPVGPWRVLLGRSPARTSLHSSHTSGPRVVRKP